MQNTSPELQTKVDVLKDMLMYREDKRQCIFTNDELETKFAMFVLSKFLTCFLYSVLSSFSFSCFF